MKSVISNNFWIAEPMTERRQMLPVSPRKTSDVGRPRKRIEDEAAIEEFYRMGDVLGKGSFGVVKEVTHIATDQKYAMKTVNKDKVSCSGFLSRPII